MTFSDWLRDHHQSSRAHEVVWDTVTVSALNAPCEAVSAAYALQVVLQGFLGHRDGYPVGVPRVPLVALYDAVQSVLERTGGGVRLGTSVEALRGSDDPHFLAGVVLGNGDALRADAYVAALPPDRLVALFAASAGVRDRRATGLNALTYSPTLGIHLRYDRPVLAKPHVAFVGSPVQWLFDAGTVSPGGSQRLRAVSSAADAWVNLRADDIVRRTEAEIATYLPASRSARLLDARVIKERRATFTPAPSVDAHRPTATGDIANLFFAGDFCQTGWPATMEGAVRSGYLAAAAIRGQACLVDDLPSAGAFRVPAFCAGEVQPA